MQYGMLLSFEFQNHTGVDDFTTVTEIYRFLLSLQSCCRISTLVDKYIAEIIVSTITLRMVFTRIVSHIWVTDSDEVMGIVFW